MTHVVTTAHARYDTLLAERERLLTDTAAAVDLLFDLVQADTDDDRELVMRRVKRFLLVEM